MATAMRRSGNREDAMLGKLPALRICVAMGLSQAYIGYVLQRPEA